MSTNIGMALFNDYSVYVGTISATIGISVFIWKKGIKPAMQALKRYNQLCERVDTIFEEITPNGGKSMKDTQDRMADDIALYGQIQQSMAADTKAALFRTDSEGDCVWVNRTYARTVGRDAKEIMGHGWINAISLDERDAVVAEWYKSVEEDREFHMNFSFETPTGIKTQAKVRSYKMVDSKGDTLGYFGNCTLEK
jgi:PAS domain S-box-containing protein